MKAFCESVVLTLDLWPVWNLRLSARRGGPSDVAMTSESSRLKLPYERAWPLGLRLWPPWVAIVSASF